MRDRIKKVKCGNTERWSFSKIKHVLDIPYLIELQKDSFKRFLTDGIREVFADFSPIVDYSGKMSLEFLEHSFDGDCKYSVKECKDRDATYTAPLRVKVRLTQNETGRKIEQTVFMGDFPMMTDNGTFIINGAERVIVSQLVRSPGVYSKDRIDKNGALRFDTTNIPNRGAWLEWEQDQNNLLWVHVDRKRKITGTVLIRALGYGTNDELAELFDNDEMLMATAARDTAETVDQARAEVYQRMRPGENPPPSGLEALINSLFFDPKRYDLARVGRYKFNKKLSLANRLVGLTLAEPVVNPETGEILAEAGAVLSEKEAWAIQNAGVNEAFVKANTKNGRFKLIGNNTVQLNGYVDCDPKELGIFENVYYPNLKPLLDMANGDMEVLKSSIRANAERLVLKNLSVEDIVATVSYNLGLNYGIGLTDNIDHLSNRRVRSAGELLQNQFKIGISRLERVIVQKMMSIAQDSEEITPQMLVNIRPLASAIKEFFGSSQLSQFMDQPNPIAELTHKRKLSALGPGGLNRERAGFDVRDVHHSHYGRMCPIETPEGQNIGLISSLSTYARVNEYGFIEAPYRRVDKEKGIVTDEVEYMTADTEDKYIVAQANEPLTEEGAFVNDRVICRERENILEVTKDMVDYMDVSPKQLVSVATALIPFLENDDTNRALMGSNMQRQAVPLLCPEAPIIGTGIEHTVAHDSGVMVLAKNAGTVTYVSADKIIVTNEQGEEDVYELQKFLRSNQCTCINQKPIVNHGQRVKADDILADGPATDNGELALGRNILIGFMTWEGYNYEDAILISEDLIKKDMFTTIHIEEYEIEARDTKLGEELITRDIPNLNDDMLKYLDEDGIIMVGAEVHSGDILVGKVTPKGETELTPEERLLRAIFGEKAREVRDTSLRVPHGESGIVVDVKIFTRENKDELSPGVNKLVRVYVAQKRKISVGDKMAGRHGNKGVISRILPREDMPFMADGTPLQIVLNPLGVPSRMNIGQVLEVHLGLIAKMLDMKIATPVFDGATENDIKQLLTENGMPADGKIQLYDGRTGEPFENRVTVGYMYMLKLVHLVDDKIHARSTGPYSLVTQQPLGGKAQFGGQRFGEMEVWALESYGAANILQEILTVKSDDVVGRLKAYESIVKGANIAEPGIPESFKVLRKELQSLALDVELLTEDKEVINISELYDDDKDYELSREKDDAFKEVSLDFSLGAKDAAAPIAELPELGAEEELNFDIFNDDEALADDEALFDDVPGESEDDDDDIGDMADLMGSIFNLPAEDDDDKE